MGQRFRVDDGPIENGHGGSKDRPVVQAKPRLQSAIPYEDEIGEPQAGVETDSNFAQVDERSIETNKHGRQAVSISSSASVAKQQHQLENTCVRGSIDRRERVGWIPVPISRVKDG